MNLKFKKYQFRLTPLAILIAVAGFGCSSNKEPIPNSLNGMPYQVLSSIILVHKEKGNESTADYQACRFNNDGDSESTEKCMVERGWQYVEVKDIPPKKYYGKAKIKTCLDKSKMNSKIDFDLMNQCIDNSTKDEDSCLNRAKVNNKIDLDVLNKCTSNSTEATNNNKINKGALQ